MSWLMWIVIASLVWFGLLALLTRSLAAKAGQLVPPLGRFVDLPGCRLHVVEAGAAKPGVPPLVMVHGLGGQVRHFTFDLVQTLAQDTRVIAIDRPGSGWSTRDPGQDPGLPTQADTVMALCDVLGVQRPVIVGHSLGGALALTLAARHGTRISGVALLAPLTHMPKEMSPVFRGLVVPAWLRSFIGWTMAAPMVMMQGPKLLQVVFGPEQVPTDYRVRGGGALSLRPSQFIAAAADLSAAERSVEVIEASYDALSRSGLPVHMIFGRQDRILRCDENALAFVKRVPHTKLTLVDGGHMLPVTQPAPCAQVIRAAMADASSAST